MRGSSLPTVCAALAVLGGCASDSASRRGSSSSASEEGSAGPGSRYRPGQRPVGGDEPNDGLVVQQEQGSLEQRDVDAVLERHVPTLVRCYERAGEAQKYVEGEVVLRFNVSGTGAVSDVLVVQNGLGNYAVERCLVVE